MDPPSDNAEATDDSSWSCRLNVSSPRSAVTLWKQAFTKLREAELDPWMDFPIFQLSTCFAKRHRYSAIKKKWVVDQVQVKIEDVSFDRGAMRECFRLKKLPKRQNDWQHSSNYVAKRYISKVDRQVYFDDVQLQMEAKLWGEAFNRQNPPKKVDIFQLSVLEISRQNVSTEYSTETSNAGSNSCVAVVSGDQDSYFFHIERFMEGEYRKYNSNTGFVDEQLRNTPQAFSHFTFERSGHRLLVVDIQGVGDLYTDPQIHTSDGVGYSDGNLGPRGMAYFFHSHRCNPLCCWLGLAPFDLAPSELASIASDTSALPHYQQLSPSGSGADNYSDEVIEEEHRNGTDFLLTSSTTVRADPSSSERSFMAKPSSSMSKFGTRRRSVSFSSHLGASNRFGPTMPRSSENMSSCSLSRRSRVPSFDYSSSDVAAAACSPDSTSLLLQLGCSSLAKLTLSYPELPDGQLDADQNIVSSSFSALCLGLKPITCQLTAESLAKETAPILVVKTSSSVKPVHLAGEIVSDRSCMLYPVDQAFEEVKTRRNRTASGDSGYFGRIGFPPGKSVAVDSAIWFEQSSPSSPNGVQGYAGVGRRPFFSASSDEFPLHVNTSHMASSPSFNNNSNCSGRVAVPLRPRRRNDSSESSDIDSEEGHRLGGNLLHQLMHESHKPSCTAHPTNLDQEIGQSILGQIHHELARLHEAGRFLPGCKGGWSCIGLGGLLVNDVADNDDAAENGHEHSPKEAKQSNPNSALPWHDSEDREKVTPSIDWEAVLFHERHAAQLGCLEAMIVMAHYFLGLPTQLLFDCSIKPDQANIRSGIDYLWRAAEGGDRRCMILLARYLDLSATLFSSSREAGAEKLKSDSLLLIPALQTCPADCFPPTNPDAWSEAVAWYDKAVVTAGCGHNSDGAVDDGLDAEGRYDAAEDLLPIYRILARMAEMYCHGGFGLTHNYCMAGDLFNRAGELASSARQGRLAIKYFELAEEAYGMAE